MFVLSQLVAGGMKKKRWQFDTVSSPSASVLSFLSKKDFHTSDRSSIPTLHDVDLPGKYIPDLYDLL